ncbi:MAG TPA: SAM-dependent chlorinase/fluorinase [Dehalococcoidales bacterium]|nr:SAM-dependent chlorinase/fluorinase [Dehalococcoidales bacterium]
MGAVITLTTDFGLADAYVAAVKGVILGINPGVTLVDISHAIRPQDIGQAAFVLGTAYESFPHGTVHVAVVDPGVGTGRRAVILKTPGGSFVAPDNGVLSYVIQRYSTGAPEGNALAARLGEGAEAVAITTARFWRTPVSATFHGRDIFAPVAAHLSLGVPLADFGKKIDTLAVLPLPRPRREADGSLVGQVIHVDSFGNLITNIRSADLPRATASLTVEVGNKVIRGLSRTYRDGGGLLALVGSSDRLEISLPEGDAAAFLRVGAGDCVIIRK